METAGLRLLRKVQQFWKPATYALQLFGSEATRHVLELNKEEAERFFGGEKIFIDETFEPGYVIVKYLGVILGCGLFIQGALLSQIPRDIVKDKRFS